MNADQVKAAIESLKNGDGASALEVLEQLLVSLATGGEDPSEPADPASASAGATGGNADPNKDPSKEPKPAAAMAALARGVIELFGGDAGTALRAVREMKADADRRSTDAAALAAVERRALIAELVALEVEMPATAWVDPEKTGADLVPVKRLADEPIAEMRKRVTLIKSTRGTRGAARPPVPATGNEVKPLTKDEAAFCKRNNLSREEFEARKASAVVRTK